MAPPTNLVQVAQHATDPDRAARFYADLLGTEPAARFDPPGLLFFVLAGGTRLLLEAGAPSSLLYLEVPDLPATVDRLRASGVEIVQDAQPVFTHADDTLGPAGTVESMAFVRDSEANLLALVGRRPA